jgi:hypothetical protein
MQCLQPLQPLPRWLRRGRVRQGLEVMERPFNGLQPPSIAKAGSTARPSLTYHKRAPPVDEGHLSNPPPIMQEQEHRNWVFRAKHSRERHSPQTVAK